MTIGGAGRVTCLVGMAGVGKSAAAQAFLALHPYQTVYFGGVVLEEVAARGLPPGETSERAVRLSLRAELGMGAMALKRRPAIEALLAEGADVLVDGLYSYAELKLLRSWYGARLAVVAVHADRSVRAERLARRPVRPLTPAEMDARDASEVEDADKAPPIALADFHLINNGDLPALTAAVARIEALLVAG